MDIGEIFFMILSIGYWIILGLSPVIVILFIIYGEISTLRENKLEEYKILVKYVDEDFSIFQQQHNYSDNKALRKFFSNKSQYKKAKEIKIEREWEWRYYRPCCSEESLKEKRIYSYKYEKLIYEIFDKWGYRLSIDEWFIHQQLSPDYITNEIARLLRINLVEAILLFHEFLNNGLIQYSDNNLSCILGYTLHNWDLISSDDYSFSKFKNDKIFGSSPRSVLDDFLDTFEEYEIVNRDNEWIMEFRSSKRGIALKVKIEDDFIIRKIMGNPHEYISRYQFGKDNSEETKNKIRDFIFDNKESLYVTYDFNGILILKLKR